MKKENKKKSWALLCIALIVFLGIILVGSLGLGGQALKEELLAAFSTDLGGYELTLAKVLTAVAALCCTYLVCRLLVWIIESATKSGRGKSLRTLLTSIVNWLGAILGVVWALAVLGLNPTAVFASLGIVALIVGFGAQSLIEDVISGLFIVFEGQYDVGDIIVLDDFRGTVTHIGMRTTSILDAGGNYKIVNNSDIRNLQNRSCATSCAVVEMSIEYSEDLNRVETVCSNAFPDMFLRNKDVFLEEPQYLGIDSCGNSSVNLKYIVKCEEANVFGAERRLRRELYLLYGENHINIPFNQVVIHQA